jgi:Mn2+/Fe2+ NRAMP family transporter
MLFVANTSNIAADVAAMGEYAELVTGVNRRMMTILFAMVTLLIQIFVPYHLYVFFLKWLTASLFAYVAFCTPFMCGGIGSPCTRSGRASPSMRRPLP